MNEQALLELRNVSKEYRVGALLLKRTIRAVNNVTFKIPREAYAIALIGESGSGKTTIAKMILGLLKPTSGEILYRGRNISEWIRKNKLEYYREVQPIFQDPYSVYNPVYRIDRILKVTAKKFKLAKTKEEMRSLITKALEDVGLRPEDVLGRYPHQLSGGERQRIMLARILMLKPRLIVADEPVSMIDVSLRASFLEKLREFKEKMGISCLYISHDLHSASYLADTIIVLYRGCIVEEGPMEKVLSEPLHPYTQQLLSSIPIPDPKQRWKEQVNLATLEAVSALGRGCPFYVRCPHAMERCSQEAPQLKELEDGRKVSCFLYY